jgi:hypothetical protein
MDILEDTIKEALDGLRESDVQPELWPIVLAALVAARGQCSPRLGASLPTVAMQFSIADHSLSN